MVTQYTHLAARIRRRLKQRLRADDTLALPKSFPQAARELTLIAQKNFRSGRYARLRFHQQTNPKLTPTRYLDQLLDYWLDEIERWDRLCHGDRETFDMLRRHFEHAANAMLYRGQSYRLDEAQDFAQRALIQIVRVGYPFDVPFDGWALLILKRMIWLDGRSHDLLDHNSTSLDAPHLQGVAQDPLPIADPLAELFFCAVEERDLLLRALRRLTPRYAKLIALISEGWSDEEIARYFNTSRANVQTLRHRARVQLLKITLSA
ncbi:MAG: hypothetical protein HY741_16390 [Chloroflexi bacterium]|nr:hypothetical protein [Chloroflexota bacterium]